MPSKYDDPQKVMEYVLMSHGQRLLGISESEPFYAKVDEITGYFSPSNGTFMDVGCGVGRIVADIAVRLHNATVYGLDPSREMIRQARKIVTSTKPFIFNGHTYRGMGLKNVIFEEGYLDRIIQALGYQSFDGISSVNVLDRVEDPLEMLNQMTCLLKRNGTLAVANAFDYEEMTPPVKRISKEQMDRRVRYLGFSLAHAEDTILRKVILGTEKEYDEWLAVYRKL